MKAGTPHECDVPALPQRRRDAEQCEGGPEFLQGKCTAVLITHADVPLFSIETVRSLLGKEGTVCVPVYQGRAGHPIRLSAEQFPQILSYQGTGGLAGAIRASGVERVTLEVEDQGILANTQDSAACESLLSYCEDEKLRPAFRFQLMRDQPFMGRGPTVAATDRGDRVFAGGLPLYGDLLQQGSQNDLQFGVEHGTTHSGTDPGRKRGRCLYCH